MPPAGGHGVILLWTMYDLGKEGELPFGRNSPWQSINALKRKSSIIGTGERRTCPKVCLTCGGGDGMVWAWRTRV